MIAAAATTDSAAVYKPHKRCSGDRHVIRLSYVESQPRATLAATDRNKSRQTVPPNPTVMSVRAPPDPQKSQRPGRLLGLPIASGLMSWTKLRIPINGRALGPCHPIGPLTLVIRPGPWPLSSDRAVGFSPGLAFLRQSADEPIDRFSQGRVSGFRLD